MRTSSVIGYEEWARTFDTLSESDRRKIRADIALFKFTPVLTVIMPVYETPERVLRESIHSVRRQLYPNWELCIVDDASRSQHVASVLQDCARAEPRIKWIRLSENVHISAASNAALSLATGEFVALLDHDDVLAEHALYEVALALNRDISLDILYSDEDQIDGDGRRHTPYFKTDWNIDLFLGHNMVSHLGVYRRALVERAGGFREGYEGSQDYDLALRCADLTDRARIHHIPSILYHWRRGYGPSSFSEKHLAQCSAAAMKAVQDHLDRSRDVGVVFPHPAVPGWSRVVRSVPHPPPLVSLIVPTRDRTDLLEPCIRGLLSSTEYKDIEILIIDHESKEAETFCLFRQLQRDVRVRVISYKGEFNYSAMNNLAVAQAKGSIIGLINNDVVVINPEWLCEMVSLCVLPSVGAVGAKLLYPDRRVQHGGVVLGVGGVANHFNVGLQSADTGYFGRNVLMSSVSAVTGACLLVKKSLYLSVGGLNEAALAVAFNDVDFCLKLRRNGYRNVWTPHAELYHRESASRGPEDNSEDRARFQKEVQYMKETWGNWLESDPFYNPNLSLDVGRIFQLASPPRRR